MCGITGSSDVNAIKDVNFLTSQISHRGPDDLKVQTFPQGIFGFARLAIIDLKEGNQPIESLCNGNAIILNGEIYNYKKLRAQLEISGHNFRTNSDAECILHLYEEDPINFIEQVNGMFAFAIYDKKLEKILLARDRLGKKPLYYRVSEKELYFCSEAAPLAKLHNNLPIFNPITIVSYFACDGILDEFSMFTNVLQLPAGSILEWQLNSLKKREYWQENGLVKDIYSLEKLIEDSVNLRLVSDVPIALLISGGMDSTIISYLAKKIDPRIDHAFTFAWGEASYDESDKASSVAKILGLRLECIRLRRPVLEVLNEIIENLDQPISDPAIVPLWILSEEISNKYKVIISGDGGDELFQGYSHMELLKFYKFFKTLPGQLLLKISDYASQKVKRSSEYFSLSFKLYRFSKGFRAKNWPLLDLSWRSSFNSIEVRQLLNKKFENKMSDFESTINGLVKSVDGDKSFSQANLSKWYLNTYLRSNIFLKLDRISMRHGVEIRSPLLDYRLFSYVLKMKSKRNSLKKPRVYNKLLVGQRSLKKIIRAPKHGMGVPIADWLKNDLRIDLIDVLSPYNLQLTGIFDTDYVHQLLKDFLSNKVDLRKEIWSVYIMQKWLLRNGHLND